MKKRVKLIGDNIYVDASYRRTILDKWVRFGQGTKCDVDRINELIKLGTEFTNPDLEHWSSKNRTI